MTGIDRKTALKIATRIYALNRKNKWWTITRSWISTSLCRYASRICIRLL